MQAEMEMKDSMIGFLEVVESAYATAEDAAHATA